MKLVKPKKFLGQHFLKDLKVAQDIADTVDTFPELPVLEVGPGMGVLTQFLSVTGGSHYRRRFSENEPSPVVRRKAFRTDR